LLFLEAHQMQAAQPNQPTCSPIIDLRQYTLFPGTRDAFVALFDREFVETQEAVGMRVIGQFRDLGDPNRFVWMRGFADMPTRGKALHAFYVEGEAWKTHAEAARAMMIDSTDALLLRPLGPQDGFALPPTERRPPLDAAVPESVVVATLFSLGAPAGDDFLDFFERALLPLWTAAGATLLGRFVTEHSANNFPRLPLREEENVFVAFTGFRDQASYHAYMAHFGRTPLWRAEVLPELIRRIRGRPQTLRLAPTSRSQLRG
jgi:hypothetical protein